MKTPKKLTTSQKLDYLIEEVSGIKTDIAVLKTDVSELKKDVKEIKREVKSHTQLLQDIAANAVTIGEHQALAARVTTLEHS